MSFAIDYNISLAAKSTYNTHTGSPSIHGTHSHQDNVVPTPRGFAKLSDHACIYPVRMPMS